MISLVRTGPMILALSACSLAGGPPDPGPAAPRGDRGVSADGVPGGTPDAERDEAERTVGAREDRAPASGVSAREVVAIALEAIGTPYEWGGTSANGFDCSGLIRYAYGVRGIQLPRVSRDQLREGRALDLGISGLRPGDILGFSSTPGGPPAHVGLYIGDGEFVHSSTTGVRISDLRQPYWQRHLVAARRIVES